MQRARGGTAPCTDALPCDMRHARGIQHATHTNMQHAAWHCAGDPSDVPRDAHHAEQDCAEGQPARHAQRHLRVAGLRRLPAPPHTRHTPRRTACKIQPLGQRVRLRQSAAAPRVLCVLTVRCAHCRSSGLPRPRRATSTRSSCARRTLALSAFALPDLLGSAVQRRCRGGRRRFRWLCFRHSALPPRRRHPIDEKYASMKNTIRPIARDSTATTALRRCGPQRC